MTSKTNWQPNRDWLERVSAIEEDCPSVSAGDLSEMINELQVPRRLVLRELLEYSMTATRTSVEELTSQADVTMEDLEFLKDGEQFQETLCKISAVLGLPIAAVMSLAGFGKPMDMTLVAGVALSVATRSAKEGTPASQQYRNFVKDFARLVEG